VTTFDKYEGLRNDFVVVDRRGLEPLAPAHVRAICDRKAGVGADGVLSIMEPRGDEVARMHVTNADGSIPQMCGNGLRCVARWLADKGEASGVFKIDTDAGPLEVRLDGDEVEVDMGAPELNGPACPEAPLVGAEFDVEGKKVPGTFVSMGNPHLVLETDADPELAKRTAPALQASERFPEGVNVGYCDPRNDGEVDLVVYERGSGLTEACGTGACAAVAALVARGFAQVGDPIRVHLPGGALTVTVHEDNIVMKGPARMAFSGQLPE
jgi:diaminopimelate epimerase